MSEYDYKKPFPFQYINLPCKDPKKSNLPIIEQIKEALGGDIQKENKFGCTIHDCHTHAGSKIHFFNFII